MAVFGDVKLSAITPADVERFLDQLLEGRSQSTRNRYRALLSAMFNRARRHRLLSANPVKGVTKFKEPEGRIQFVMPEQEAAVLDALRPDLRSLSRSRSTPVFGGASKSPSSGGTWTS
jgi:integrase